MNNTIILYKSKYGSARKYALWLKEALQCDTFSVDQAEKISLTNYKTVIMVGSIYASGISVVKFLKTNLKSLSDKRLILLAVGASPFDETALAQIKKHNLKDIPLDIPLFYARGTFDMDSMNFMDRTLCKILKKSIGKKSSEELEPWMMALLTSDSKDVDFTDKAYLKPLIDSIG